MARLRRAYGLSSQSTGRPKIDLAPSVAVAASAGLRIRPAPSGHSGGVAWVVFPSQVQEMLRIEHIFEAKGIQEELDVYNPLIPDGHNWKATFMVEYSDETERRAALARLLPLPAPLRDALVADLA